MKAKQKLAFEILHDEGNKVAEAFGIMMQLPDELIAVYRKIGVDLEKFNGDTLWRLPVPSRFVIDKTGILRFTEGDPDYTTRPEADQLIDAVRALGA